MTLAIKITIVIALAVVALGWMGWRNINKEDIEDELGFAVFKSLIGIETILCLYWFVLPFVLKGNHAAAFIGVPFLATCGVLIGVTVARPLVGLIVGPLLAAFDGGRDEVDPAPLYSPAIVLRRDGKFDQALAKIDRQLERFPRDIDGLLMRAEILATDLYDFDSARETLEELPTRPVVHKQRKAAALMLFAEWAVDFGRDPETACAALEDVKALFPGSQMAEQAQDRIDRMPTREKLLAPDEPELIPVRRQIDALLDETPTPSQLESDKGAEANRLIEHLKQRPGDASARERLAILYAEFYQRIDLAEQQLEQLVNTPGHSQDKVTHWLNLIADFHLRLGRNAERARAALEEIIARYPDTRSAHQAIETIARLPTTEKLRHDPDAIPMSYAEKDRGIKYNRIPGA